MACDRPLLQIFSVPKSAINYFLLSVRLDEVAGLRISLQLDTAR